jgi:hypothetical protein
VTVPAGPLPGFFIVGAQKSGTSTLHRLLQQHPQAYLCDPKEPHYFSDPSAWAKGEGWYRSLFADAGDAVCVGEASTTYTMYPHYAGVVERLTSVVPEPRLIYLLREPIARMRSAYLHALTWGSETRPIERALVEDPRYLLTSSYALQIERWAARVPRGRMLLLSLDQLQADPGATLALAAEFLGLDPAWRPPTEVVPVNASEGKRAPRAWWRAVGELTLRTGTTQRIPDWVVRLNGSHSPAVRRAIDPQELEVPAPVVAGLRRALREDQTRLATLWGTESVPPWLHNET